MKKKVSQPKVILRKKIMIADDDPAIVDSLTMMLEYGGYEVTSTLDGATILNTKSPLPDLLLLDIWMSGEDGKEICKTLKSKKKTKHFPIILLSASQDIEKAVKESGADGYIAKPFQMNDLFAMIEKYTS